MRKYILLIVISFILGNVFVFAETLTYKSTTGDKVEYEQTTISVKNGGYILKTKSESAVVVCHTDEKYNNLIWESCNDKNGLNVIFNRIDNTLDAKGLFKGKPYQKKFKIDSNPWYQDWGLGLKAFVGSGQASADFWSVEPNQLIVNKFRVVKGELTKVIVNGREEEAFYVKVSLTGFIAVFWHADFWFRPSDGRLLFSKMSRGMNVPITVSELYEEK